jgi:DNA adenine methylase
VLFPYFGGKSKVAPLVWEHLGDPECYIEPFGGSLAVLLARPTTPKVEIAVDLDGLLVNFWRSVQREWPSMQTYLTGAVHEIDLRAKHQALIEARDVVTDKLAADPEWCNPMLAAWWWEGISSYLGSGFGHRPARQRPHIDRSLKGVWANRMTDEKVEWVMRRLANVVLLSGDWSEGWKRACTPAIVKRFHRGTGVFLDPPYADEERQKGLYAADGHLHDQVVAWALDLPRHVRVVIAGYGDEYPELRGWQQVVWKAPNGYAQENNQRRRKEILYVRRQVRTIARAATPVPD